MAEGVGVSDEQLDEWERAVELLDRIGSNATRDLIGEVRASHARETELLVEIRDANEEWSERYRLSRARAAELQQRIDKALLLCDRGLLIRTEAIRAALTGTGNQSTEETP